MKTSNGITYHPSPGLTPEQARDIRARAWAYVFSCFERRQGKEDGDVQVDKIAEPGHENFGRACHKTGGGD